MKLTLEVLRRIVIDDEETLPLVISLFLFGSFLSLDDLDVILLR